MAVRDNIEQIIEQARMRDDAVTYRLACEAKEAMDKAEIDIDENGWQPVYGERIKAMEAEAIASAEAGDLTPWPEPTLWQQVEMCFSLRFGPPLIIIWLCKLSPRFSRWWNQPSC